jgi:hypothetical protein
VTHYDAVLGSALLSVKNTRKGEAARWVFSIFEIRRRTNNLGNREKDHLPSHELGRQAVFCWVS